MLRHFEERYPQGPDVRGDGVGLPGNALGRHVIGGADECVGIAAGAEFAANAEVAEFDLAIAAEEDVRGFDVYGQGISERVRDYQKRFLRLGERQVWKEVERASVDDFAAVEIGQAVQDAFADFAEDFLANAAAEFLHFAVNAVEAAAFAVFHRDGDDAGGGVAVCAVVFADVVGCDLAIEVELSSDLLLRIGVGVCGDDLVVFRRLLCEVN